VATGREQVLANLERIRSTLARAAGEAGRDPASVRLVAVGKGVDAEPLRWVREAGVTDLGENYVRELRGKHDLVDDARWHFIGTLQASGAHHVAALADVVQTVVPGSAAERLGRRAAEAGRRLPALVEVDFTGRRTGVAPEGVAQACDAVAATEGLAFAGLMTIAPPTPTAEEARPHFRRLRALLDGVRERHPQAVELSMGMSLDYEVAVLEGATMVRIGRALFGSDRTGRAREASTGRT
jgi:pyridoxal phosphate enzyme (YggS family)